jgi:AraC-like DNA-binding protein
MFFYEGQSCPVCGKYFAETDDIVSCPACGAPHHRECWRQEGQCHFAADHGTERQWPAGQQVKTEQQKTADMPYRQCPNCGKQNPEFAEFCSHCGRDLGASEWQSDIPKPPVNQYTPPFQTGFTPPPMADPLGGIPRGETIEGVAVETLAGLCGMSASHFHAVFRREVGLTPVRYRHTLLVQEAMELLLRTNLPVEEISDRLGFSSSCYFRRVFSGITGKTPLEIRE